MRITESLINQFVLTSNAQAKEAIYKASNAVATGSVINRPADDPVAASRIVRLGRQLEHIEGMRSKRGAVESELNLMDATLQEIQQVMRNAKDLAVQMSNDSATASDRLAAAKELGVYRKELVSLVNRRNPNGGYFFTGTATSAPYDDTGQYLGTLASREVEVGPGIFVATTLAGPEVFGEPESIFSVMQSLDSALRSDDPDGVRASLDGFDQMITQVGLSQTEVGARLTMVQDSGNLADALELELTLQRSGIEDADLTEQVTRLSMAESSLSAVVEVSQRVMASSVLRWLS